MSAMMGGMKGGYALVLKETMCSVTTVLCVEGEADFSSDKCLHVHTHVQLSTYTHAATFTPG